MMLFKAQRWPLAVGVLGVLSGIAAVPAQAQEAGMIAVIAATPNNATTLSLLAPGPGQKPTPSKDNPAVRFDQHELDQSVTDQARAEKLQRLQAGINQAQPTDSTVQPTPTADSALSSVSSLADGIYLYGQQPVPNQLATAYFVFESQGNNVTGAFYMPSSSFDCVEGRIGPREIALNVTDSYSQETSQYALGLETPATEVASTEGVFAAPPDISGFHPLPVSDDDRDLLATCQARY